MSVKYERIPYLVIFEEVSPFKDTYAGEIGKVVLEAHLLKSPTASDIVVVMMHPIGGGSYLPLPGALARQGVHVIYCNSRYRGSDTSLIMEKVAMDLGACVRDAKERLGYEKVILGGWSGGGALSLFYQAEAETPTVTHTPAGDVADLTVAGLIPADGVMLLASHLSRNLTLTEWLDPSVTDESRPFDRAPALNLYAADGPKPPFSEDFLLRFRDAQVARNRRITAWVKDELAKLRAAGLNDMERCFVVQGTMADPRFVDPSIDPNDRKPNWCFLGDPRVVNDSPVGLGRYSSLRSWLSQWSYDDSNADGLRCAARITVPLLILENGADDACTPSHAQRLAEAAVNAPQSRYTVQGANHYYFGQMDKAVEAAGVVIDWLGGV